MVGSSSQLTPNVIAARARTNFRPSKQVRIGAEVEWLVYHRDDSALPISVAETSAAAQGPLPAGGAITIEPGGQLELVTQPAADAPALIAAIETDTEVLVERFAAADLVLVPVGLDPVRPANRTLDLPRYVAMEQHFADVSPVGREMMCRTASLQLNIDFGPDPDATWCRAAAVAPLLAATFANSPTRNGETFHPVSHRQQIWAQTDASRTQPLVGGPTEWHDYIRKAQVMLRHGPSGVIGRPETPSTFGAWLDSAHPPTAADLDLHLTTLWPPLRPRGFLEIRMLDAVPRLGRAAAITTVWKLFTDPDVGDQAGALCSALEQPWAVSTWEGLRNSAMRRAAVDMMTLVGNSVDDPTLAEGCAAWSSRVEAAAVPTSLVELLAAES